jgi:uncharacterized membrane protein YfcA
MIEIGLLSLVLLNALSSLVYGIASFGNGLVFHVGWQVCSRISLNLCSGDTTIASIIISYATMIVAPVQAIYMWKTVDWKLFINLSIPQLLGTTIGISLTSMSSPWFPRGLGLIMFCVASFRLLSGIRGSESVSLPSDKFEFHSATSFLIVWGTALSSGLLSGAPDPSGLLCNSF